MGSAQRNRVNMARASWLMRMCAAMAHHCRGWPSRAPPRILRARSRVPRCSRVVRRYASLCHDTQSPRHAHRINRHTISQWCNISYIYSRRVCPRAQSFARRTTSRSHDCDTCRGPQLPNQYMARAARRVGASSRAAGARVRGSMASNAQVHGVGANADWWHVVARDQPRHADRLYGMVGHGWSGLVGAK